MTLLNFPHPTEPPELRLPISSATFADHAHHQHPALDSTTLCMLPIPDDARWSPHTATEVQPTDCEDCQQALWFAQKLLESHTDHHPADPPGLRWSAGASLLAAWTLDGIAPEVFE